MKPSHSGSNLTTNQQFILHQKNVSYRAALPPSSWASTVKSFDLKGCSLAYQIFKANKHLFEWLILISRSAMKKNKSPGPRGGGGQSGKGQISQLEFSFVFTLREEEEEGEKKHFSKPFSAWASQTRSPLPHVPHMCLPLVSHTHACMQAVSAERPEVWKERLPSAAGAGSELGPLSAC